MLNYFFLPSLHCSFNKRNLRFDPIGHYIFMYILICISAFPQLYLSPHWSDTQTISFSLWPWKTQNRRHPGHYHRQLHCCVWALPPHRRIQICVLAAYWWAMWTGAFHFSHLSALLRSDQPQHPAGSPLLHLPVPWRPARAAKITAMFGERTKHPQKTDLQ